MVPTKDPREHDLGPLCLPLLKFSYATVPVDSVAPIQWSHLPSKNDLFAMFETSQTRTQDGNIEERKMFKVMKDPDVMEDLDLQILSREAHRAMAMAHDPLTHNHDPNIIAIIVKAPLIAMRYPVSGGQVRRFQIRFASTEDYYEAMKMLSRADVPTLEAGTFPTQRPQTAPISSSVSVQRQKATWAQSECSQASPIVHSSGQSKSNARISSFTLPQNLDQTPAVSSALMASLQSSLSLNSGTTIPNPTTLQLSQGVPCRPKALYSTSPLGGGTGKFHEATKNSPFVSDNETSVSRKLQYDTSRDILGNFHSQQMAEPSKSLYTPRPSTAPVALDHTVSQLLPPRRDLPFELPKAKSRRITAGCGDETEQVTVPKEDGGDAGETDKKQYKLSTGSLISNCNDTKSKRKRMPAKSTAKLPVAKRSRLVVSGTSPKKQQTAEQTSIPSVEELLQKAGDTQEPEFWKRSDLIDTQALLTRAKQTSSLGPGNFDTVQGKTRPRDAAANAEAEKLLSSSPAQDRSRNVPPLTSEIPMMKNHSVSTHSDQPLPSNTVTCSPMGALVSETPRVSSDICPSLPTVEPRALADFAPAWAALIRDPNFANSNTSLATWSKLPPEHQQASMNTYFCQQFQNPDFLKLCQAVDRSLQRMFVYHDRTSAM